jgi:hypothetical protein
MRSREISIACAVIGAFAPLLTSAQASAATMTQSYIVHMFHQATYSYPTNCPKGGNGSEPDIERRMLRSMGYSPAEVRKIMEKDINTRRKLTIRRGHDASGALVNAVAFPTSVPDPKIELVSGPYAYGFDLDGKGPGTPGSFIDPQTRQGGVDNQLFRALGCYPSYNMTLPVRPQGAEAHWDLLLENMPAWVFSISGDDLAKDGNVTVTFYRATQHAVRDALGRVQADATYVIEPAGRTHGEFHGAIRDGLLTVEPADISIEGEPPLIHQLDLTRAQLRFSMRSPDRRIAGWLGGYVKWVDIYFQTAVSTASYVDEAGLYYALRRLADADPDPKTGQNQRISVTYRIEATPIFLARSGGALLEGTVRTP